MVGCGAKGWSEGGWVNLKPNAQWPLYRHKDYQILWKDPSPYLHACGSEPYPEKTVPQDEWRVFCSSCLKKFGVTW